MFNYNFIFFQFGTWSSDDSEVVTELGSLGLQIHPNFQENAEWRLVSTETKQEINNNHKVVEFYLTIERNSRFVTYYMTVPVIMLAYMNVVTFIIPTESGEKSGFSVTIFLSFVVLLIINNDSLPENSDTISLYAAFLLTMTIMSAIALLISALQIRAISFETRRYPLPKCFERMINYLAKIRAYLPFANTIDNSKRKREKKEKEESNNKSKGDNEASASDSSGYFSSPSSKKRTVAFKIDNEDNSETEENDRFVFPRKREISNVSFKRETTLFEENAIIRPSTASTLQSPNKSIETPDKCDETEPLPGKRQEQEHITSVKPEEEIPDNGPKSPFESQKEQNMTKRDDENTLISKSDQNVHSTNSEYDLYESEHFKEDYAQGETFVSDGNVKAIVLDNVQDHDGENHRLSSSKTDTLGKTDEPDPNKKESECSDDTTNQNKEKIYSSENVGTVLNIISYNQTNANTSQQQDSPSENVENTVSKEVQINTLQSVGHQSGSIFDEIMELQTASATEYKMNRPESAEDNRPLSVNKLFTSEDRGLASANIGRALSVATSRPVSRNDGRALSGLTQRSMSIASRKRPASLLSQNYNTALLFGDDESEYQEKQTSGLDNASQISSEQPSESVESSIITENSDMSEEDGPEWSDFVSCTDVIFFFIYLFITTLMSLAMFLTMVTAY